MKNKQGHSQFVCDPYFLPILVLEITFSSYYDDNVWKNQESFTTKTRHSEHDLHKIILLSYEYPPSHNQNSLYIKMMGVPLSFRRIGIVTTKKYVPVKVKFMY